MVIDKFVHLIRNKQQSEILRTTCVYFATHDITTTIIMITKKKI